MLISVHPRDYDISRARNEHGYSRLFTYGWVTTEVKTSSEFCDIITKKAWSPIVFRNGHRCGEDFVEARLLVLDFDSPEYSLAQCLNEWCDTLHWIGTSKSHQIDKRGIICDRFRLIVPYEKPILDEHEYTFNYKRMLGIYPSDPQTKDSARLFFPCQKIVSVNLDGFYQEIYPAPPKETPSPFNSKLAELRRQLLGKSVPKYIDNFVEKGVIPPWVTSRQRFCWDIAKKLKSRGWEKGEVESYLIAAKFNRDIFDDKEILQAVKSAFKKDWL